MTLFNFCGKVEGKELFDFISDSIRNNEELNEGVALGVRQPCKKTKSTKKEDAQRETRETRETPVKREEDKRCEA
jgi:hypothetical protein